MSNHQYRTWKTLSFLQQSLLCRVYVPHHSSLSSYCSHTFLFYRLRRHTSTVGFQWQLESTDEAGDGRPSWILPCLSRLQSASVSNLLFLCVDAKEHHRRMPIPDNAEKNIACLPYWIGGYDLEVNVSNLQHISRWLLK